MAKELSADVLLFHILPRLPAKSLCRFRFVSKQWYEFITTPQFAKMQLHHQNQNHQKLLLLSHTTFRTIDIDCEDPNKGIFSFSDVPLPFNVVDHDLSVVSSFHGMVCVGKLNRWSIKYSDLILWNPLTGDYKTLSKHGIHKECYDFNGGSFELYYSSSEEDYKLVHIIPCHDPNVYIYSLKSDSWRKVDSSPDFRLSSYGWWPSRTALLNEKLYFLVDTPQHSSYSILRLDTNTEKFTEIATPFPGYLYTSLSFFVLRGCIHLYLLMSDGGVELWRMDGDGEYCWTKVVLAFPRWLQEPLFLRLNLMKNENWFHFCKSDYTFYQVYVKKHTRKILCALQEGTTLVEYMETIVSPNQYTK